MSNGLKDIKTAVCTCIFVGMVFCSEAFKLLIFFLGVLILLGQPILVDKSSLTSLIKEECLIGYSFLQLDCKLSFARESLARERGRKAIKRRAGNGVGSVPEIY